MIVPLAAAASPFMWLPFVAFWVACLAAIWAEIRETEGETDLPDELDQPGQ